MLSFIQTNLTKFMSPQFGIDHVFLFIILIYKKKKKACTSSNENKPRLEPPSHVLWEVPQNNTFKTEK